MNRKTIVTATMLMLALPLVVAVPEPLVCGPVGSSTTGGTHNYEGPSYGNWAVVYDQCAAHYVDTSDPTAPLLTGNPGHDLVFIPHAGSCTGDVDDLGQSCLSGVWPGPVGTGESDEAAAGFNGAVFMSADDVVGVNAPVNDLISGVNTDPYTTVNPANVGGVNNCVGAPFTAHHGVDRYINTRDKVQGGNIRLFVTGDAHDDSGEQAYDAILTANGGAWPTGVDDPRDPCGDNSVDATDLIATSDPCDPPVTGSAPPCAVAGTNVWDSGSTLSAIAGLDGTVWTLIVCSAGNASVDLSGITWTTQSE